MIHKYICGLLFISIQLNYSVRLSLYVMLLFLFVKQNAAYQVRISNWCSDVFSSDLKRVTVRFAGRPIPVLNELETIDGQVWSNVWMTDFIVRIDPATGNIASLLDLSTLKADEIGRASCRERVCQYV